MHEKVIKMAGTCMSMLFPRSVTFPSSRHLKTAESGTSMMSFLARNAELTGNFGGSPQGTFFIHDGQLESTEMFKIQFQFFFMPFLLSFLYYILDYQCSRYILCNY